MSEGVLLLTLAGAPAARKTAGGEGGPVTADASHIFPASLDDEAVLR